MLNRRTFGALLAISATAGLAACSGKSAPAASGSASASGAGFPVTITHAFGTTTIKAKPQRVATLAWANHEVPLALGVSIVGMSKATWGDDDGDGMLPWVKDAIAKVGGDAPVLFDETDGVPFSAVADTKPDVILCAYSGLTKEDYETLSKIAPVVAYPKVAWGTTMNEMIQLNSQALGMSAEGDALIKQLSDQVKASFAKHPELAGKKLAWGAFNADDLSKVTLYTSHDPRASFLAEAGLATPSIVEEQSKTTEAFFVEVSSEKPEAFDDVDAFLVYGTDDNAPLVAAMKAHPLVSRIKAVAADKLVFLGNGPLAASANPSPLSIPRLDEYVSKLAEAAK